MTVDYGSLRDLKEFQANAPESPDLPGSLAQQLRDIGAGRKPLPTTTDAIRHHYIAQFILKRFLDPTQPRERLWQLDKNSGQISPQSTEKAASVRRLYRVEGSDGNVSDHLEAFFAMVEGHAAQSMDRLIEGLPDFNEGDRANLSFLFSLQDQRTPAGQKKAMGQLSVMGRLIMATNLAARPEQANALYLKNNPDKTVEEADAVRLRSIEQIRDGDLLIKAPKEMALNAMLMSWLEFSGAMHGLGWKLLHTTDLEFVLGDRPMVMHDPTPDYPFSGNGLLSSPSCYSLMPLTPELCLRLDQSGPALTERRVGRQVAGINLRSYGWAERFVYARSKDLLEELHAEAVAYPDSVPLPRPNPQVIMEAADFKDPTIGAHHPPGYPRGLWKREPGEEPQFCSYDLQYPDDPKTVGIDEGYLHAVEELEDD